MRLDQSHQRISLFGKIITDSLEIKEAKDIENKKIEEKKNPHIVKTFIADSDDEGDII